ncbi:hypothetical protein BT96DRAFT_1016798 [Gymnopus androsaceus JB14]|uniref:Uncharacterized protein n=1 Tax=Gymnopus androsaceus JB14 TaxID=1447944 RepID=A0A6A4I4L5_9AGAR|nr:hypothetical protein BT96DRAFT_1016798 [Gymnopus androsaceus JB14]
MLRNARVKLQQLTSTVGYHVKVKPKLFEETVDILVRERRYAEAGRVFMQDLEPKWRTKGLMLGLVREDDTTFLSNLRVLFNSAPLMRSHSHDFIHLFHIYQHQFGFGLALQLDVVPQASRVDEALEFVAQFQSNSHPYTAILANAPPTDMNTDRILSTMSSRNITTDKSLFNVLIRDQARKAGIEMGTSIKEPKITSRDDASEITQIWDSISRSQTTEDKKIALERAFVLYHALCSVATEHSARDAESTHSAHSSEAFKPDFYTYRTLWGLLARRPKWKFTASSGGESESIMEERDGDEEDADESPIVHPRKLFYDMSRFYLSALPSFSSSDPSPNFRSLSSRMHSPSRKVIHTATHSPKSVSQMHLLMNTALLTFLARGDYPVNSSVGFFGLMRSSDSSVQFLLGWPSSDMPEIPLRTYRIILTHLHHRVVDDLKQVLGWRRRSSRKKGNNSESASDLRGFKALLFTQTPSSTDTNYRGERATEKEIDSAKRKTPHEKIMEQILSVALSPIVHSASKSGLKHMGSALPTYAQIFSSTDTVSFPPPSPLHPSRSSRRTAQSAFRSSSYVYDDDVEKSQRDAPHPLENLIQRAWVVGYFANQHRHHRSLSPTPTLSASSTGRGDSGTQTERQESEETSLANALAIFKEEVEKAKGEMVATCSLISFRQSEQPTNAPLKPPLYLSLSLLPSTISNPLFCAIMFPGRECLGCGPGSKHQKMETWFPLQNPVPFSLHWECKEEAGQEVRQGFVLGGNRDRLYAG